VEVTFALVGITVVLIIGIAAVLLWAVRTGQFEDMEGPAWRVVMDDDRTAPPGPPAAAEVDAPTADDEAGHGSAPPDRARGPDGLR
jgi:cbb3-type cytochrome oxidase maturation protein